MISIVIPLFNKEKQIKKTLDSVYAQTFKDFEVIIVNDGSTDSSVEVVKTWSFTSSDMEERISEKNLSENRGFLIRIIDQENSGVSAARNRGIEEAKGEYIAFLDADDEWKPDYLQTQADLIKKYPEASVFATNYEFKDENGKITPTIIRKLPFKGEEGILSNYFQVASYSHPPLWTSAVVAKKVAIQKIGGFPVGIVTGEDLLTWANLSARFKIVYCIKIEASYLSPSTGSDRQDPEDMSIQNDLVRKRLKTLFIEYKPKYYNSYLSFWDKMRAVINLKKLKRKQAIRYSFNSILHNPLNTKSYLLFFLSFTPSSVIRKILK